MNDLDLVREFRADVPGPTAEQLAIGRELLLGATRRARTPTRRLGRRPGRARFVLVAAVLAAVGGVLVLDLHGGANPASPGGAPDLNARLAAQVLRAAATSLASQPTTRPAPHQWIYSSFVDRSIGQPAQPYESWSRFDGRQTAYLQNGQLIVHTSPLPRGAVTPISAYDQLASLPSNTQALLHVVDEAVAANPVSVAPPGGSPSDHRQTRAQLEFEFLTQLLWQAAQAAPARAEAAVFRALATVAHVSAQHITDAVGRSAIALSDTGVEQQLLLDPLTYKVIGLRTISDGTWPVNPTKRSSATYPKGTVIDWAAWIKIADVNGPGDR